VLPTEQSSINEAEYGELAVDEEVMAVISAPHSHFDFRKLAIATLYLQNPKV
jgi:hypothetical protein